MKFDRFKMSKIGSVIERKISCCHVFWNKDFSALRKQDPHDIFFCRPKIQNNHTKSQTNANGKKMSFRPLSYRDFFAVHGKKILEIDLTQKKREKTLTDFRSLNRFSHSGCHLRRTKKMFQKGDGHPYNES